MELILFVWKYQKKKNKYKKQNKKLKKKTTTTNTTSRNIDANAVRALTKFEWEHMRFMSN